MRIISKYNSDNLKFYFRRLFIKITDAPKAEYAVHEENLIKNVFHVLAFSNFSLLYLGHCESPLPPEHSPSWLLYFWIT